MCSPRIMHRTTVASEEICSRSSVRVRGFKIKWTLPPDSTTTPTRIFKYIIRTYGRSLSLQWEQPVRLLWVSVLLLQRKSVSGMGLPHIMHSTTVASEEICSRSLVRVRGFKIKLTLPPDSTTTPTRIFKYIIFTYCRSLSLWWQQPLGLYSCLKGNL